MRILLVSGSVPPMRCGVGDYTAALARTLSAQSQTHVAILTSQFADTLPREGDYEQFNLIREWSWRDARTAFQLIQKWKPDVVHLQYPTLGYTSKLLPSVIPLLAWAAGAMPVRTWHEAFSGRASGYFLVQFAPPGPSVVVRPNFSELMWPPLRPVLGRRPPTLIEGASSIPRSSMTPEDRQRLRLHYLQGQSRLIVFFGFLYRFKGADQVFKIADPARDALVIIGNSDVDLAYTAEIAHLCETAEWTGRAELVGYLPVQDVADLLAAADAAVLPFLNGGGSWNSSISAAVLQGTPVVTTAHERRGLNETGEVYFAEPNNLDDLRKGLMEITKKQQTKAPASERGDWNRIAADHMTVYERALREHARRDAL